MKKICDSPIVKKIRWLFEVYIPKEEYSLEQNRDQAFKKYALSYGIGLGTVVVTALIIIWLLFFGQNMILQVLGILVSSMLFIFGVALVVIGFKNNSIFAKFAKEISTYSLRGTVYHYSGLPNFIENQTANFRFNSKLNSVVFIDTLSKRPTEIELPLNKIYQTQVVAATEIVRQSRGSSAALGGLLFGAAGAVLGALCAEEQIAQINLYVINYISNGEKKAIVLRYNEGMNSKKLTDMIDSLLPDAKKQIVL